MLIYTVGHSTRTLEAFVEVLASVEITRLVDIRSVPRSRRHPHFNEEALAAALPRYGINYLREARLGGFRRTAGTNSTNDGWDNASFRAYADYMQTEPFRAAIDDLLRTATRDRLALMCAEAVPWRCHRRLVADALTVRGIEVHDLIGAGRVQPHRLTPFARVDGPTLTYPRE